MNLLTPPHEKIPGFATGYCRCLFIRFSSFSYWLNAILLLISGLTIFIAGLGAHFEFGLKRIVASSTLRQLHPMIITIYIGLSGLAFFHLLTHALFKALLCHL